MTRLAIVNADVYTPTRIVNSGVVLIRDRRIEQVGRKGELDLRGARLVDAAGHFLAPGFVDIRVHGGGGGDFTDGALQAVRAAASTHLRAGTTTMFASTTYPLARIVRALKVLRRVVGRDIPGLPDIPGVHVVGPFEAGATHVTHLYSAMSSVRRVEAKRFAGVLEAALERDDLTTEIIADGKHLPTSLLRLAFKCKGPDRLALISDSMRAVGMPQGRLYEVCGQMALYEDGVGYTPDKKSFASSAITLDAAVRHMVQTVGISLRDALTMAALTPARIMGIDGTKGSLQAGRDADLVLLHRSSLQPVLVMARGRIAVNRLERGAPKASTPARHRRSA